MFPWLIISDVSLVLSVIFGLLLWLLWITDSNISFDISHTTQSLFSFGIVKKIAIVAACILCVSVPLYFYAESQRPVTITPAKEWTTTDIQNISSLSGNQRWSVDGGGSFLLGSGTIYINGGSVHEYAFYKTTPNGYQLGTLDATNVFIKEDENKYPYIEWVYSHSKKPLKQWGDEVKVDWKMDGKETTSLVATYIHVPNGTVIKEYTL
jgi:hypothetical protein